MFQTADAFFIPTAPSKMKKNKKKKQQGRSKEAPLWTAREAAPQVSKAERRRPRGGTPRGSQTSCVGGPLSSGDCVDLSAGLWLRRDTHLLETWKKVRTRYRNLRALKVTGATCKRPIGRPGGPPPHRRSEPPQRNKVTLTLNPVYQRPGGGVKSPSTRFIPTFPRIPRPWPRPRR